MFKFGFVGELVQKRIFRFFEKKLAKSFLRHFVIVAVEFVLTLLDSAQIECLTSSRSAHCYFRALHEKTTICYYKT